MKIVEISEPWWHVSKITLYEHHESRLNDGNISFYLIHVPFTTLEKYAIELQINKRVNEDYVNMAQSNVSFELWGENVGVK